MIKFSKPVLFLLFALSTFLLGIIISYIIKDGLKTGKDLVFQLFQLISLIITSSIFFIKLYVNKQKV